MLRVRCGTGIGQLSALYFGQRCFVSAQPSAYANTGNRAPTCSQAPLMARSHLGHEQICHRKPGHIDQAHVRDTQFGDHHQRK